MVCILKLSDWHMPEDKGGELSALQGHLPSGVPEGSVVGSLVLSLLPLHLVIWFLNKQFHISSMQVIASCMCPLDQATQLQHSRGYNHAWPLSSHGCWCKKLKPRWNKCLPFQEWMAEKQSLSLFPIDLFGVETYPTKSVQNLGIMFNKNFHLPLSISGVCSSCFYHIQDLWCTCSLLDLDLAHASVSICLDYCDSFCLALQTLTSLNFSLFRINWPVLWQSHHHLLIVFTASFLFPVASKL